MCSVLNRPLTAWSERRDSDKGEGGEVGGRQGLSEVPSSPRWGVCVYVLVLERRA